VDSARHSRHADNYFLIEFAMSPRARLADAWARAEALATAGALAGAAVVLPNGNGAAVSLEGLAPPLQALGERDWKGEMERFADRGDGSTLVVSGDDAYARARGIRWPGATRVWPTRLDSDADRNDRALRCAVAARPRAPRTRVPLWDGHYLLAPERLHGRPGRVWIEAFARLASEHDMLDLVILADPEPELQRLARERGVSLRVHWAGASPLRAECLWMACASALLVGGGMPDASTLLRALETSVPLLVLGDDAPSASLAGWLAEHGAASSPVRPALEPALGALRSALAPTPEMRLASARAAALSARHLPAEIATALRDALSGEAGGERRAA
jgi:hypothetical protein